MNQVLQQRPTTNINREIRSMLRIYMVNLLTSEYGIESFTKQSIDCFTDYVCKNLVQLLLELKFMVNSQGRTIPNFLHLFLVWERNNMKLDNFLDYLKNKISRQLQMKALHIAKRYQTKRLIEKHNSMSSVEFAQKNYANIYYIPQNYINIKHILEQPIPIKKPIDQYVDKPPFYSYCQDGVKKQTKLNEEAIKRQAINSEFQMKIMLQKHQKFKANQNVYQNASSQNKDIRINRQKISFDLCKYL